MQLFFIFLLSHLHCYNLYNLDLQYMTQFYGIQQKLSFVATVYKDHLDPIRTFLFRKYENEPGN